MVITTLNAICDTTSKAVASDPSDTQVRAVSQLSKLTNYEVVVLHSIIINTSLGYLQSTRPPPWPPIVHEAAARSGQNLDIA